MALLVGLSVFPTTVGMNRSGSRAIRARIGVPHDRGDEPGVG